MEEAPFLRFSFGKLSSSELPVCIDGLDGPFELLAQGLGEELFDGHVESLGEDGSEAGVDVVLVIMLDMFYYTH